MKKTVFIFMIFSILSFSSEKKIGLVLAGGGAKGFAHIGVLKVLEEEKIPIDYIVGTSMGSIIGALYAIGYTPEEMEKIILEIDWLKYFNERIPRENTPLEKRFYTDRYVLYFPVENMNVKLPRGVIKGQYIENLLNELYMDVNNINDFKDFPIKFACVATDVETGEKVVLDKGNLSKSVRASMSIPTAFTPIEIDNKLLIDGMMVSNFPVEVAKDMGADIIIGCDLKVDLKKNEDLKTLINVLEQTSNYQLLKESNEKAEITDILIIPELDDYSSIDFHKAPEMIALGEKKAREKINELKKYGNENNFNKIKEKRLSKIEKIYINKISIKGNKKFTNETIKNILDVKVPITFTKKELTETINNLYNLGYFNKVSYLIKGNELEITVEEIVEDELKLGFNYNSYNFGEFYINASRIGLGQLGNNANLDIIVGKNSLIRFQSLKYIGVINKLALNFSAEYKTFDDYKLYNNNEQIGEFDISMGNIGVGVGMTFEKNNLLYTGITKQYTSAKNLIKNPLLDIDTVNYFYNYFHLNYIYDSLDDLYFPKKGYYLNLEISGSNYFISDYKYVKYNLKSKRNFKISDKLTLNIGLDGKLLESDNAPLIITPTLGGFNNRMDSIEFWGLNVAQYFSDKIGSLYNELSYEFNRSRYLFFRYNIAVSGDTNTVTGYGVGVGASTVLGPISIIIANSDTDEIMTYFNVGYQF